jgi:hypothetical protein
MLSHLLSPKSVMPFVLIMVCAWGCDSRQAREVDLAEAKEYASSKGLLLGRTEKQAGSEAETTVGWRQLVSASRTAEAMWERHPDFMSSLFDTTERSQLGESIPSDALPLLRQYHARTAEIRALIAGALQSESAASRRVDARTSEIGPADGADLRGGLLLQYMSFMVKYSEIEGMPSETVEWLVRMLSLSRAFQHSPEWCGVSTGLFAGPVRFREELQGILSRGQLSPDALNELESALQRRIADFSVCSVETLILGSRNGHNRC